MFGKLLKYDFRSMLKQFGFIWPAALALALINRFTLGGLDGSSAVGETAAGIAMLVYVAILMAMFVIAVIFVIQRFYKGLLGDEGYLMHTLPVKPWQLVASKLLTAVLATMASVLVAVGSIFLIAPMGWSDLMNLFSFLGRLFTHWNIQATHAAVGTVEVILLMMASFAVGYLELYLAMALGHLFSKHRAAMSFVAFIGVQVAIRILGNIVLQPVDSLLGSLVEGLHGPSGFHATVWIAIAGEAVVSAIYFAGTEYILRRRLNLE